MENSFHSIISDVGRFASDVGLLWWAADLFTLAVAISGLCAQVAKSAWSWIRRREIKGRSKKLRLKIRWAWIFAFCVCVSIGSFNAWRKKDAELQREVNRYFNSSVEMVAYGKDPSKDGDTIVAFGALIRVELTNSKPSIVRQWRISIPKMAIEGAKCLEMGNYGLDVYGKGGITSRFPFLDTFGKTLHDGEQLFGWVVYQIPPTDLRDLANVLDSASVSFVGSSGGVFRIPIPQEAMRSANEFYTPWHNYGAPQECP